MRRPTYFFISVIVSVITLVGVYNAPAIRYNTAEVSSEHSSFFPFFRRRDREPKPPEPQPSPETEKNRPFLKKVGTFFSQLLTSGLGWLDIPNKLERIILYGFALSAFLGSLTFYVLVKKYRRKQ